MHDDPGLLRDNRYTIGQILCDRRVRSNRNIITDPDWTQDCCSSAGAKTIANHNCSGFGMTNSNIVQNNCIIPNFHIVTYNYTKSSVWQIKPFPYPCRAIDISTEDKYIQILQQ